MSYFFVKEFLIRNEFNLINENSYANSKCNVVIDFDLKQYQVANNYGEVMYSNDLNIYWLIGYLTFNDFIDKNYI